MTNTTDIKLLELAQKAKKASTQLSFIKTNVKNGLLEAIANNLQDNQNKIFRANEKDLQAAESMLESGEISPALYKRLSLSEFKFRDMVAGVRDIINLDDPIGTVQYEMELDKGLNLKRVSCPLGVVGVIFESRPDVVVQISSLAIKSSNAVILKGGAEAINTNLALVEIINDTIKEFQEFPEGVINLITSREEVKAMLDLDEYIDLIIPRGSNSFVKYIQENTRIPVLGHSEGICHIYVDEKADMDLATKVSLDSKIEYPAACNAVETILVHKEAASKYMPKMLDLFEKNEVRVKCDPRLKEILGSINVEEASEEDWSTEYGDLIVSIKVVDSFEEAVEHINKYGSGHTECIITKDKDKAEKFMALVDAAGTFWNASTRFADGFRYGLGAEVGISTNKTHARGPVGLEGLTIYKYQLVGDGHIVDDYSKGAKKFKHKRKI